MYYLRDELSSANLTSAVFGTEGGFLWTRSQWQMIGCYWIIKSCNLTCVTPSRLPVALQKLHLRIQTLYSCQPVPWPLGSVHLQSEHSRWLVLKIISWWIARMIGWLQTAKWTRLFTFYFYHIYERHAVVMEICKVKGWRQSVTTRLILYYYITLKRYASA